MLGLPADDGSLLFFNTNTQEIDLCIESAHENVLFPQIASCISLYPTGQTAVSGGFDCALKVWDLSSGEKVGEMDVSEG